MAGILAEEAALIRGRGDPRSVVGPVPGHVPCELALPVQLVDALPAWFSPISLGEVARSLNRRGRLQHGGVVGRPLCVRVSSDILVSQTLQEPVHKLRRGLNLGSWHARKSSDE